MFEAKRTQGFQLSIRKVEVYHITIWLLFLLSLCQLSGYVLSSLINVMKKDYLHVRIWVHSCVFVRGYTYMYSFVRVCMHLCVYVDTSTCVCMRLRKSLSECMSALVWVLVSLSMCVRVRVRITPYKYSFVWACFCVCPCVCPCVCVGGVYVHVRVCMSTQIGYQCPHDSSCLTLPSLWPEWRESG